MRYEGSGMGVRDQEHADRTARSDPIPYAIPITSGACVNSDSQYKIAVVGLGKIGLPLAAQFAGRGRRVIGCDINPAGGGDGQCRRVSHRGGAGAGRRAGGGRAGGAPVRHHRYRRRRGAEQCRRRHRAADGRRSARAGFPRHGLGDARRWRAGCSPARWCSTRRRCRSAPRAIAWARLLQAGSGLAPGASSCWPSARSASTAGASSATWRPIPRSSAASIRRAPRAAVAFYEAVLEAPKCGPCATPRRPNWSS